MNIPEVSEAASKGTIFISYSPADTNFVAFLFFVLATMDFTAQSGRDCKDGSQRSLQVIQDAIDTCLLMVVVMSPDAMEANDVKSQCSYARQHKKIVVPLDYRLCKIPLSLRNLSVVDFRTISYEQSLQDLVQAIDLRLGTE